MKNYVPPEKRSKKAQKELNARERCTWDGFNPATRKVENKKLYNRKKAQVWYDRELFLVGVHKQADIEGIIYMR